MTTRASNNPAGRPLSQTLSDSLESAVIALLAEHGYKGISMDAVARRAGVSRPALYRRFATVAELTLASLENAGTRALVAVRETDDLARDLEEYLAKLGRTLGVHSLIGQAFRGVLSEAVVSEEFAARFGRFIEQRRQPVAVRLRAADPQLAGPKLEDALDLLFGPVLYRLMVRQIPVSRRSVRVAVQSALQMLSA